MARYIDADKALTLMWNALWKLEDEREKMHGLNLDERSNIQSGFEAGQRVIANMPTEDVDPVVRAKWIMGRYCSNCECDDYDYCCRQPKFCPECGAEMKGKEDEDDEA